MQTKWVQGNAKNAKANLDLLRSAIDQCEGYSADDFHFIAVPSGTKLTFLE